MVLGALSEEYAVLCSLFPEVELQCSPTSRRGDSQPGNV